MDNIVLLTLILGGAGVALAFLGIVLAVLGKVTASRVAQDLQNLRQEMNQVQSAKWMQGQELENQLKLRRVLMEGMQKIKDELTTTVHAEPGKVKKEAIYKTISDLGRQFSTLCEKHADKLNETELVAAMLAKDTAIAITYQTRTYFDEIKEPADLSSSQKAELLRLRSEMSEAQSILRDRIQNSLVKRVINEERGE